MSKNRYEIDERKAAEEKDSISAKVMREVQLVGTGLVGGFADGMKESVHDPLGTGMRLAGTVGIGVTLGLLQRQAGMMRLGSQIVGSSLGLSFAADVVGSKQWSKLSRAAVDTWDSPINAERNREVAKQALGRFAFDTTLMTAAGIGSAKLAGRFMVPRNELTVSDILGNVTRDPKVQWRNGRPAPSSLATSFENFPVKAKGLIEVGKDAVVIELQNNSVLKIFKEGIPKEAGTRAFDLPILKQGTAGSGRYEWLTQPKVEVVQDRAVADRFAAAVKRQGYNFWDFEPTQLGYYKGEVRLHDYDAVAKLTLGSTTQTARVAARPVETATMRAAVERPLEVAPKVSRIGVRAEPLVELTPEQVRARTAELKEASQVSIKPEELTAIRDDVNFFGKEPSAVLVELMSKNRVLGIGEKHMSPNPHRELATEMMPKLRESGATHLALEIDVKQQYILDRFQRTGKFTAADAREAPGLLKDKDFTAMLESAREAGLKLVAVDNKAVHRDSHMAKSIGNILDADPNSKVVFWVGKHHLERTYQYDRVAVEYLREKYKVATVADSSPDRRFRGMPGSAHVIARDLSAPVIVATGDAPNLGKLPSNGTIKPFSLWDHVLIYPAPPATKL